MKMEGRLGGNPLKSALDDVPHVVVCGARHSLRLLMKKLRPFLRGYPAITQGALRRDRAIARTVRHTRSLKTELFRTDSLGSLEMHPASGYLRAWIESKAGVLGVLRHESELAASDEESLAPHCVGCIRQT